jgi:amidohydrolase
MKLNLYQERILLAVQSAAEQILSVSHQIHENPELGNQEVFASGLLEDTLEAHGFTVERGYAGIPTAFCACKGTGDGPVAAYLAEYDALPSLGHACGHNIIACTALAAGIGLGNIINDIPGQVRVVGTPAEETAGAKVTMVQKGCFKDIDVAMMIHPFSGNFMITNSLALSARQVSFYGKPSHAAASPWEGVNALDAMILTFNNLNALRQQIQPDARLHGIISKGGEAPNIIPEHTEGRFYIRAKRRDYLGFLLEKFTVCVEAAALATGCRFEITRFEEDFDDMLNNMALVERMRDYMIDVLGSTPFESTPDHFGSIDMGNVSHVVPAFHILIDITEGKTISPHTREFARAAVAPYANAALLRAGKGMALTGYDVLTKPEFFQKIREEFNNYQNTTGNTA